jgi:type IV pilus assembly protein PilX
MLAFTALRTATIQERMSGNARDRGIALQAAEAALRAAEKYLAVTTSLPTGTFNGSSCAKGVYKLSSGVPYLAASGSSFSGSATIWDGASSDFWNEYPWETANCSFSGSTDYITFVSASDYGKPGKPTQSPRYVIEELPANGTSLPSYRVTAKGYGSSTNAVVILQATYTSN